MENTGIYRTGQKIQEIQDTLGGLQLAWVDDYISRWYASIQKKLPYDAEVVLYSLI